MENMESKGMFEGLFKGADLSEAQIIVVNESGGMVINHQQAAHEGGKRHFPLDGDEKQGREVYQQLINERFIAPDCDEDSFLFIMGYKAEINGEVKQIVWLQTKQLAREFVTLKNQKALDSKLLKMVTLEEITEKQFVKDGKPLKLAKNKPVISSESDTLLKIMRPKATTN